MSKIKTLLIFCFFFSFCFAETITIDLKSQNKLDKLYLLVRDDAASFDHKNWEDQVRFDLNFSGYAEVMPHDFHAKGFDRPFWKTIGANYVARITFREKSFFIELLNVKTGALKAYPYCSLSGNDSDRDKIHGYVSDITYDLFGKKGIQESKILYSLRIPNHNKNGPEWLSEIWMCDFDGKNQVQMTHNNSYSICPRFLPNGEAYLYVSYSHGQPKIKKAYFDSKEEEMLVRLRGSQALPSTSSSNIAFISDAAGRPDLFLFPLDETGKPVQLFSSPRATQASSTFSPDGRKIAFVSDKDGPPRIYILEIPRTNRRFKTPKTELITKKNRQNTSPSWSPDGRKLAYSAKTNGIGQIWIYDFDSKQEWQLTFGAKNMENPCWAHDSHHLVFNSEDKFMSELYLMNIHQKAPIKISTGPGGKRFPVFSHRE